MESKIATTTWIKIVETILAILSSVVPFLRKLSPSEENEE